MTDSFDPELLRIHTARKPKKERRGPPRHTKGERFLMGPIPWNWIAIAAQQRGHALHVALAIWFLAFVTKNREVKLSQKILRGLGVSRYAVYRGLKELEAANLVTVKRQTGRLSVVTILEAPRDDGITD